jgi:spore maturation protein CgeB
MIELGGKSGILIVGLADDASVSSYLRRAAEARSMDVRFFCSDQGYSSNGLLRSLGHRFLGGYPSRGGNFNRVISDCLTTFHPGFLLTTGRAPVFRETLEAARKIGVRSLNYSTDDPWNNKYAAGWFFRALASYDVVATPRSATMHEFESLGVRSVVHVPFGYCPDAHRAATDVEESSAAGDVFFAGGCDADRIPFFEALVAAGLRPLLFGGYWERCPSLRPYHRGFIPVSKMAVMHARTPVSVCLVRRANRDEHVMRTFEAAAMGACLVMEDSGEHRRLFGPDGESVVYFSDPSTLVAACQRVLADVGLRQRLRISARQKVLGGPNSYGDRLDQMLATASEA